jgi:hypothetical protein
MNNCREIGTNGRLTNGLTTVMLIFSLFLFSGYVSTTQAPFPELAKTELVVSANQQVGRRAYSIHQVLRAGFIYKPIFSVAIEAHALLGFNRLIKIKHQHMAQAALALIPKRVFTFLPVETIPHKADELYFTSRSA